MKPGPGFDPQKWGGGGQILYPPSLKVEWRGHASLVPRLLTSLFPGLHFNEKLLSEYF